MGKQNDIRNPEQSFRIYLGKGGRKTVRVGGRGHV